MLSRLAVVSARSVSLLARPAFSVAVAPAVRTFASKSNALAQALQNAIVEEQSEEQTRNQKDLDRWAKKMPDFKLQATAGFARFFLTREFGKNEHITVEVDCSVLHPLEDDGGEEEEEHDNQDQDQDGAEDQGPASGYPAVVTIAHGDARKLVFKIVLTNELVVHEVEFFDAASEEDEDNAYPGPVFHELDPELQEAFYVYLEERGITNELAEVVSEFSDAKEADEYRDWLRNVKSFVEGK